MNPQRLVSDVFGIDAVLGGGLLANSITMVCGPPGSGKTILAQSYAFQRYGRPAVYVSTVSEPFDKVVRYGQALKAFDVERVGTDVFYEDIGAVVLEQGLDGVGAAIDRILKERNPAVLVIDSFAPLSEFAATDAEYRRFLHTLAGRLSALAVSVLWVGEFGADELSHRPEFAMADSAIYLHTRRTADREFRVLTVLKHRGSDFISGEHGYRIDDRGLRVFPRLADPREEQLVHSFASERASSGIPALDEALGGGYMSGSSTLVVGSSGTGKTLMGLHLLQAGAEIGERGVLATLQEDPAQLARVASGFGWTVPSDDINVLYRPPIDLYLDEWVYELLDLVESSGAKRVVIDSLGDLYMAASDELRFREYVYSLLRRFSQAGVGCMMTLETKELFETREVGRFGMSHLSDNVLLLQRHVDGSEIKRGLAVLKTRATPHDGIIREFTIDQEGISLGQPLKQRS